MAIVSMGTMHIHMERQRCGLADCDFLSQERKKQTIKETNKQTGFSFVNTFLLYLF
jgi:hypothetical protein